MKASLAWKLARRGKSAKLVLAASTRISMVAACVNRKRTWPNGTVAEHGLGDLGDHRLGVAGDHLHLGRQPRDAEEHGAEQAGHDHQRLAGVLPLDGLEGGHAVGDGLDAGHGGAAGGEGVQEQERR